MALRATSFIMACCFASAAAASEGLIAVESPYNVSETIDRLEEAVKSRGINVFLRLDHAQSAKSVGKHLRPTELIVFGNPKAGTPLMECAQTAGIDLPLKALAWQDAAGKYWLGYNDPRQIASRHAGDKCGPIADNIAKVLGSLAQETVQK
ncbi:DUF302 domain-containing protein [Alcaligenes sp.]|uniref:DUF302 domain-containing protein n=1 Tax=Alcaligenes sp. TaxID=512 RepID=UPI003CFEEF3C